MWKKLKSKTCVNWGLNTTPDLDQAVKRYIRADASKRVSLSIFVERSVMDFINRESARLGAQCISEDRLLLSDRLGTRKRKEGHRRTIRWCILVSVESDTKIRKFLRTYKARHGAMVRLVEDAVIEAMLAVGEPDEIQTVDINAVIAAAAMRGGPSGSGAARSC